jgi:hypothetical protein
VWNLAQDDKRNHPGVIGNSQTRPLSPLQVGCFLCLVVGATIGSGLASRQLTRFFPLPILFVASFYSALVLALAYLFSPQVFTGSYWRFPSKSLKWVGLVVGVQAVVIRTIHYPWPVTLSHAAGDIVVAPLVEEVVRAVIVPPLVEKWGTSIGIAATTVGFALLHRDPLRAVAVQLALSLLFLYSNRSIPACATAHSLANGIAVWHAGIFVR